MTTPTSESWSWLLTHANARKALSRVAQDKLLAVAPAGADHKPVFNIDPRYRSFLKTTADNLTTALPAKVEDNGAAGANGVISDFLTLRTLAGFYMDPMSVPMSNNESIREELRLASDFASPRHEAIWREVGRAMFGQTKPAALAIRRAASTGFPFNTNDMEVKGKLLQHFLVNAKTILAQTRAGRLEQLAREHGIFYAFGIGVRSQADTVVKEHGKFHSKPREVNDEAYARSGGRHGSRFTANKDVVINGNIVSGLFAMRRRTVYAAPFAPNHFLAAIMSQFRGWYLNEYSFTWKHRGAQDLDSKIAKYPYAIGMDVKQFDQSVAGWMLDFMIDQWSVTEDVKQFAKITRRMPFAQSNPYIGATRPFNPFFGDPWDLDSFVFEPGLPSGISWNPDAGKFAMTATYLCLLDDYYHDVVEFGVGRVLKGEHPHYALLDASDDGVLLTTDAEFIRFVNQRFDAKGPEYFRLEPESGISFLGNVLMVDLRGERRFVPNIKTYFTNLYVPEHGLPRELGSGHIRPFAAYGYFERQHLYRLAPAFAEAYGIADDVWHHFFDESINARWEIAKQQTPLPSTVFQSAWDLEALLDPSAIYKGRFDVSDLSPAVRERLTASISWEALEPFIAPFFA